MANTKIGFGYWSFETDRYLDIKIKRLKKDFGPAGVAIHDYILNEIFRVKGCYMEWDDSVLFDVAEYWGAKEDLVTKIVEYCCLIGLFNVELFTTKSIITSKAIQVRFLKWSMIMKRKDTKIPEEYNLLKASLDILQEKTPKLQEVCPEEEKKRKEEPNQEDRERKEEQLPEVFTPPVLFDVCSYFKEKISSTGWPAEKCEFEAQNFIDYYGKTGWKVKQDPIVNWQNAANGWIKNDGVFQMANRGSKKTKHPDRWDPVHAAKLDGPAWSSYIGHLHSLGLHPVKRNGLIIDFVKNQL